MKKTIRRVMLFCLISVMGMPVFSQSFKEWRDANVNEVNRFPMHTHRKSIILCIEINVFVNRNERLEKKDQDFLMSDE